MICDNDYYRKQWCPKEGLEGTRCRSGVSLAVVKDSTQRNNWTQLVWPPDKKEGTTHDPYYKFVYCRLFAFAFCCCHCRCCCRVTSGAKMAQ